MTSKLPFFHGLKDPSRTNLVISKTKNPHISVKWKTGSRNGDTILCLGKNCGVQLARQVWSTKGDWGQGTSDFIPWRWVLCGKPSGFLDRHFFLLRFFLRHIQKKDHRVTAVPLYPVSISNELSRNMKARTSRIGIEKLREGIAQGNPFSTLLSYFSLQSQSTTDLINCSFRKQVHAPYPCHLPRKSTVGRWLMYDLYMYTILIYFWQLPLTSPQAFAITRGEGDFLTYYEPDEALSTGLSAMELTWDLRFVDGGEGRSRYDSTKSNQPSLEKEPIGFWRFNPLKKTCFFKNLAARDGLAGSRRVVFWKGFTRCWLHWGMHIATLGIEAVDAFGI